MSAQSPSEYYRYCPGEEHIKLSDAVCRGRRRSSFPKCRGCQFNDDERHAALAVAVGAVAGSAAPDALATSDVFVDVGLPGGRRSDDAETFAQVARGTTADESPASGRAAEAARAADRAALERLVRSTDIRGAVPEPLSANVAWRIGHAAAQFFRSKLKGYDRADPRARSIVTASDMRSSSASIHAAMVHGVRAAGVLAIDIGAVDAPQLCFAVRHLGAGGGILTTGGRSPEAYSGFKLCGAGGRDVATATGLADIRDIAARVPQHDTGTMAGRREADLSDAYRTFVRAHLPSSLARPLTLVADAGGGVMGRWMSTVFSGIEGLTLVTLHDRAEEPFPHDPNPTSPRALGDLRRAVKSHRADIGVCFDPDGDGCVFVDERGTMIRPDLAAALAARRALERSKGGVVVVDHGFGRAAEEEILRAGGTVQREPPDAAHVRKTMAETQAVFGATLSGQFFFRENGCCESGMLAVTTMLGVAAAATRRLSEVVRPLARYRMSDAHRMASDDPAAALARAAQHFGEEWSGGTDLFVRRDEWWLHAATQAGRAEVSVRVEAVNAEMMREKLVEAKAVLEGKRTPAT
ncbi:MAG: hypothetical protein L6R00_15560 [Phycisphaerae bacterium]|nr:hypothetical protein [Phycisphaerae bacterium]